MFVSYSDLGKKIFKTTHNTEINGIYLFPFHLYLFIYIVFQDTVVALQALSRFAAMIFSDTFNIQATVTAGTFTHTFNINKQNALVMQSVVVSRIW